MSGPRAGRAASRTVSPPPKPKSVVAGLGKPGGKKASHPKSPSPPPTRIPDVEMRDIAAAAGEETEDSDTVVVPRMPGKGKGKELVTAQLDGTISPPPGKGSVKVAIKDKISSTSALPPPPGETESEDEPPKKEAVKPVPAPVKKTIGRIGKIGGKKAAKKEVDDDAEMKDIVGKSGLPSSSSTSVRTLLPPTDRKHEPIDLTTYQTRTRSPQPPGPPVKVETPEPEPEEDEDEKADRKRRQLEKELEARKKAPAKKKRKF